MKTVTVLGATGSIGRRTLDLIAAFPEQFRVGGLAARGSDVSRVAELVRTHRPAAVALLDDLDSGRPFPGIEAFLPAFFPALVSPLAYLEDGYRVAVLDASATARALEAELEAARADRDAKVAKKSPVFPLEALYAGHFKLLSLMLADIARKADAGLDTLDWIASLGLPVEEFRDDDDPPADQIHERMEARMDAMWAQEDAWLDSALG